MAAPLKVTLYVSGVGPVETAVTSDDAAAMLQHQGRYIFRDANLSDGEKVERMVATEIELAFVRGGEGLGTFVADDLDGKKWLIPNRNIVAAVVDSTGGVR